MTIEKAENYNDSFNNDFCQHLEFHLSKAFANSDDKELKYFWCDGVLHAPYYNSNDNIEYLKFQNVIERGYIRTTAWIGKDGQGRYDMTIKFGQISLDKYKKGESMIDCLHDIESLDWIDIDIEHRIIEIQIK